MNCRLKYQNSQCTAYIKQQVGKTMKRGNNGTHARKR